MKYVVGLFIASVGFFLASQHLNQGADAYWDYVAFSVVVLGTFAVMLVTFPAAPMKLLFVRFAEKFLFGGTSLKNHVHYCYKVTKDRSPTKKPSTIEEKLLHDGLELIDLGFTEEKIQEIISKRFEVFAGRINMLSSWLRRGAKYPPAFGLAGTVLGLIHLMRGVSQGIDPKETGLRMAIALVATFYGLLLSNLLLNPLGEWLHEEVKRDEQKAEITLLTVMLISRNADTLEIQEVLNSFLSNSEKIKPDFNLSFNENAA